MIEKIGKYALLIGFGGLIAIGACGLVEGIVQVFRRGDLFTCVCSVFAIIALLGAVLHWIGDATEVDE